MSSKIGTILSFIFIALYFVFGIDLVTLQFSYSDLDAKSVAISSLISQQKSITTEFENNIENKYGVDLTILNEEQPLFGDVIDFIVAVEYDPLVISSSTMTLRVKRSTVLGYYK
jgi:hypothetical protein